MEVRPEQKWSSWSKEQIGVNKPAAFRAINTGSFDEMARFPHSIQKR